MKENKRLDCQFGYENSVDKINFHGSICHINSKPPIRLQPWISSDIFVPFLFIFVVGVGPKWDILARHPRQPSSYWYGLQYGKSTMDMVLPVEILQGG